MRVLFIGDVAARAGRTILAEQLPALRASHAADLVIANVENAAHGIGVSPKIADRMLELGVDVMTGGNHLLERKEILEYLENESRLLRPANWPEEVPGSTSYVGRVGEIKYLVATLSGRTFMAPADCPFRTLDRLLAGKGGGASVSIIDFHAEATSEKYALARYADGRISALVGTHTHVQTADEQILPGGTAFISDVGMTGPHGGIIGMRSELVMQRFLTGMPTRFEPAETGARLQAVVIDIDEHSGLSSSIERIDIAGGEQQEL